MNSKQFLRQAYRFDELIKSNQEELKHLQDTLRSLDLSKDKVQTSPSADSPMINQVAKILELEKRINADIESMLNLKIEIRDAINRVEDANEKLLLRCRYLNFMSWDDICKEMKYSVRTVHRIHQQALKNFVVPEKWHTMT